MWLRDVVGRRGGQAWMGNVAAGAQGRVRAGSVAAPCGRHDDVRCQAKGCRSKGCRSATPEAVLRQVPFSFGTCLSASARTFRLRHAPFGFGTRLSASTGTCRVQHAPVDRSASTGTAARRRTSRGSMPVCSIGSLLHQGVMNITQSGTRVPIRESRRVVLRHRPACVSAAPCRCACSPSGPSVPMVGRSPA